MEDTSFELSILFGVMLLIIIPPVALIVGSWIVKWLDGETEPPDVYKKL